MPEESSQPTIESDVAERRASLRLAVHDQMECRFVPSDLTYRIRDIGFGGFAVDAEEPLSTGTYVVRFTADRRWSVTLLARTRYCLGPDPTLGPTPYVMGLEFEQRTPESRRMVESLIDRLTSDLTFD